MINEKKHFIWTDAWLLLSLLHSGQLSDRKRIREVGGGINHAIFTDKELEEGLVRLIAAGYVSDHEGLFLPTQIVINWFRLESPERSYIHKDLERVESFIHVSDRA